MKNWILCSLGIFFAVLISGCSPSSPAEIEIPIIPTVTTSPVPTSTAEILYAEVKIPRGAPATIDGTLLPGEWDDAASYPLSENGRIYVKYADGELHLAVDGEVLGTLNLGMIKDGNLWILHSSAALGSLVFQPSEEGWILEKNWQWCCRGRSTGNEEESLFTAEGWFSHNQFIGNELQTEIMIRIPEDEILIAVTYLFRDGSGAAFWPSGMEEKDLLQFSSPPQVGELAPFSIDGWAKGSVID